MKKILKVDNPNVYAQYVEAPQYHPLVSVIHYDEVSPFRSSLNNYGVYGLFIQREFPKILSYGMKMLQASDASIIAVAPGQIGGAEDNGQRITLSGWVLLWSPELLHDTHLEGKMKDYRFFSYFATESLRMNDSEWQFITTLLDQLRHELRHHDDTPALRHIILGYIHLVLEYCNRIHLRQISQEDQGSPDILKRFHAALNQYFDENRQLEHGLPSVSYFAGQLAYSPRYFGDLIRKTTGSTAISHIHDYVINLGKNLLMNGHNVNETARLLGFDYPHHFTRLFKKVVGITPSDYLGK